MSVLLKEIEKFDRSAPSVFQEVGLQMDDEIQTLTRDDLQDLFPGRKNFKLRKNIFDIIYKQRSDDVLLREPKDCLSWESFQATLRANSVLTEYLNTLKELKTQVNNVQMVIEAPVDQLEELNKYQHQKAKRGKMSVLLKEIEKFDRSAPSVFQEVGLQTDDEIQTLTRDDLQDLFPERKNFKLRKNIFDIIYKQRSDDVLLRELKECFSFESCRATLRANSVLTEYLNTLKELKTQVNNVQMVIERHVDQLEELNKNQHQKAKRGQWFPKIFSSFGSKTPQTDHHKPAAGCKSYCSCQLCHCDTRPL
ncbi:uncharacterized protein LOC117503439 [Thalassophryne amazonica]|uniref:uncharacterized protein LOC117503439 n=1 Tax=Thalassophryne amazonica TaxID=390379 RepID=UPI001471D7AC|nr:uncharacterized protein LOC117503439 [Thalassophryne amazonica]